MGLKDFFAKRKSEAIPGISVRELKHVEGFDAGFLELPLFKDLVACCVYIAKTDVDITRISSRRYAKRLAYGNATINDKSMKKLFESLEVEREMLSVNGYITKTLKKLNDALHVARKRGDVQVIPQCEAALNVSALVLARYVLELHPEYQEQLVTIAPFLKENA